MQNQALLSDDAAFAQGVPSNVVTTPVIQPAVVTAIKSVTPTGEVTPGTQLTYTIDVQNTTAGTATNVVFTDAIPANSTYVAASCSVTGGTVNTCNGTGTFNIGNTRPLRRGHADVQGHGEHAGRGGQHDDDLQHRDAGPPRPEARGRRTPSPTPFSPTPDGDDREGAVGRPAADVDGFITPGSTITYTLTVNNPLGAVPATSVVATDLVPAGTTYVDRELHGGRRHGQHVQLEPESASRRPPARR